MSNKLPETIVIRSAQAADLPSISWIEQQNFSKEEAASPHALKERLEVIGDTFLVLENKGQVAGYVVGPVLFSRYLTDAIFQKVLKNPADGGFIMVQSLSIHPAHQRQGLGSLLLAALKEVAVEQDRKGISLTCHDELVSYYQMNGFTNEGLSDSKHGGASWWNMVWENPYYEETL